MTQTTPLSFPPGLATNAPTQSNVLCDENEIIAKKISSSLFIVRISFGTGSKLESVTLLVETFYVFLQTMKYSQILFSLQVRVSTDLLVCLF